MSMTEGLISKPLMSGFFSLLGMIRYLNGLDNQIESQPYGNFEAHCDYIDYFMILYRLELSKSPLSNHYIVN